VLARLGRHAEALDSFGEYRPEMSVEAKQELIRLLEEARKAATIG
jgi:hypothetical protein